MSASGDCVGRGEVDVRDVTIDEMFTWREDMGRQAKEAFGSHVAYANSATYAEVKAKTDVVEKGSNNFTSRPQWLPPLNGFTIYIDDSIPDGILRGRNNSETK